MCRVLALSWALFLAGPALTLGAGVYPSPQAVGAEPGALLPGGSTNPPVRLIRGDLYQLGSVQFDRKERTILFPCVVNMADGLVEYAIVHSTGKVHESVLKTEARPLDIQLARLLLSSSETPSNRPQSGKPRELIGASVELWVDWEEKGAAKSVRLEDLVWNALTKAPMPRGEWIYNGSRLVDGTFLADRDGSIVTIISDPDALINNPRPGRDDDEIWRANHRLVPLPGTLVKVKLRITER